MTCREGAAPLMGIKGRCRRMPHHLSPCYAGAGVLPVARACACVRHTTNVPLIEMHRRLTGRRSLQLPALTEHSEMFLYVYCISPCAHTERHPSADGLLSAPRHLGGACLRSRLFHLGASHGLAGGRSAIAVPAVGKHAGGAHLLENGCMIYTLLSCPLADAGGRLADGVQAAGGYAGGAHVCDAAGGTGALHRVAVHPGAAVGPPAGALRKVSSCASSFLPVLPRAPSASCSMFALHAAATW